MPAANREETLTHYCQAYDELVAALPEFPAEMWQFRPAPGEWSVHEIIIHLSDSEANSFVRCRRAIAEPGLSVMAYDESGWAARLNYHAQSTDAALELFRGLRAASYHLIKDLPEATWQHTIEHPENGTMTLDDWLLIYANHVTDHVAQMRANYQVWSVTAPTSGFVHVTASGS